MQYLKYLTSRVRVIKKRVLVHVCLILTLIDHALLVIFLTRLYTLKYYRSTVHIYQQSSRRLQVGNYLLVDIFSTVTYCITSTSTQCTRSVLCGTVYRYLSAVHFIPTRLNE